MSCEPLVLSKAQNTTLTLLAGSDLKSFLENRWFCGDWPVTGEEQERKRKYRVSNVLQVPTPLAKHIDCLKIAETNQFFRLK